MADVVKYLYGDASTPTVNGVNLPTRTIVKYTENSSGTVTSSRIYVFYSAIPGGRDSAGNTFGGGTPTSLSNFDPGGYSVAAVSGDGGKTFTTFNYNLTNTLPSGVKVGDPILGAAAIASLNTPGSPYYEAVQNQIINAAVNTRPGLAPQLAAKLQTSTSSDPNVDQNPNATGPNTPPSNGAVIAEYNPNVLNAFNNELENFKDSNITKDSKITKFLSYPTSINNGQDKILISQIEYVPSTIGTEQGFANIAGALANREVQFETQQKEKLLGTVMLPMPNDISESNQTGWGESSLSTIAAAFMGNAAGVAGAIANAQGGEAINQFRTFLNNLGNPAVSDRLEKFLTANAAASVLKFGGINVDPEAYINRATGVAINPNLELLFNGPKLRQFGFSFKMTPRSPDEARNIRSIVKFFKKGMAPRRSTEAEKSIYLGTPNVFRLKFMSAGEIGGIGKIKTCALVSCSVNYTPDGFYTAYDGPNGSQPIATVMQLAFTELTPVYNDEYDANDEYNIGPDVVKELKFSEASPTTTLEQLSRDVASTLEEVNQLPGNPLGGNPFSLPNQLPSIPQVRPLDTSGFRFK